MALLERRAPLARALLAVSLATFALAPGASRAAAGPEAPAPPPNDARASAQRIGGLPATLEGTTVGATTEASEAELACTANTGGSVWYELRTSVGQRIGIDLRASGVSEEEIVVYHASRSQLNSEVCESTNKQGRASLSFSARKNGVYYIRVAPLRNSPSAPFAMEVFLPTPAVAPPGPRLPPAGVSGAVDRVQNINAAYSLVLRSGVSYLISLANQTEGACVSGHLFAPGTTSFEGSSVRHIGCGGYQLFTPGPGKGGVYSFEVTPSSSVSGVQRYHLQVAPAGPAETAPGLGLHNYERAHGYLAGASVHVLRLYRMQVTTHSNLTLRLSAPQRASFNLRLLNEGGGQIGCDCEGSGAQTLQHQLQPGRYYAVVSVRDGSAGAYTLERESRTITSTSLSFSTSHPSAGTPMAIDVKVAPASSGPVSVDVERFDPVFGWQFYTEGRAQASEGLATVAFIPPALGRWRAKASYGGSLTSSPSAVGFSYLLVS